jgi:hypothetical protein
MVEPITDDDVPEVARFLQQHMNTRVPVEQWAAAMTAPWQFEPPNHGVLLRHHHELVGAYLALYSKRVINGRDERFCNLAAWCVLEAHRSSSFRMLRALLAQPGFHFTDLSPSGNVIALNARFGFAHLDTTTAVVANVPWRPRRRGTSLSDDPAVLRARLPADLSAIHRDHAHAPAAHHLLLERNGQCCYVMFRRDRRKGLPLFANLLHVSHPGLLVESWPQVSAHLLLRHRLPATLVELRLLGGRRPQPSTLLAAPRRKMYRSDSLGPDAIDYLYSELVALRW